MEDGVVIDHGIIKYTGSDQIVRINKMRSAVKDLCNDKKPVDKVYIEDIQMQMGNAKGFKTLAWNQCALVLTVVDLLIPYELVSSSTWRGKLGFTKGEKKKRDELKLLAHSFVLDKFGITATEDECEAICMAYAMSEVE